MTDGPAPAAAPLRLFRLASMMVEHASALADRRGRAVVRRCAMVALPTVGREPVAATEDERDPLAKLERLLEGEPERRPRLLGSGGEAIELPESVVRVLRQVV